MSNYSYPLYVDLDRSLVKVDMLIETFAFVLRRKPYLIPFLILKLLKGKPQLKAWLEKNSDLRPDLLPYNQKVIDLIKHRGMNGSRIILATASNHNIAKQIASQLGLFHSVLASSDNYNLKGKCKLEAIQNDISGNGDESYDYLGDSPADIPIWEKANKGYLVSHSSSTRRRVLDKLSNVEVIDDCSVGLNTYLKLLRPHQWTKNVLLFVPLLLSYQWSDAQTVISVIIATFLFSLAASTVYILNDFVDVEKDRDHHYKRRRPFASGAIPLWHGPILAALLLLTVCALSIVLLSYAYCLVLLGYVGANLLYSFWLKQKPILDVVLLTLMYTFRIYAGSVAAGISLTPWLLTFSMFFFFSLAFAKRYQELLTALEKTDSSKRVRGYYASDLRFIEAGGIASGLISILVMALYIRSPQVEVLYSSADLLWLICPLALYWIGRVWLITSRGRMHDDPIVFALKDGDSYIIGFVMGIVLLLAHYIKIHP